MGTWGLNGAHMVFQRDLLEIWVLFYFGGLYKYLKVVGVSNASFVNESPV